MCFRRETGRRFTAQSEREEPFPHLRNAIARREKDAATHAVFCLLKPRNQLRRDAAIVDSSKVCDVLEDECVRLHLFNDPSKVRYFPLNPKDRFTAVQSGEVDILSRQTTWSLSRDTSLGLAFSPITYFDGQALMVKKSLGIASAKDLGGSTICVQGGTTSP